MQVSVISCSDFRKVPLDEWQLVHGCKSDRCISSARRLRPKHMIAGGERRTDHQYRQPGCQIWLPAPRRLRRHQARASIGLTRSNAIELGEHGITVNAVCPNHVTTGLGAKQNDYYAKLQGKTLEEFMQSMRDTHSARSVRATARRHGQCRAHSSASDEAQIHHRRSHECQWRRGNALSADAFSFGTETARTFSGGIRQRQPRAGSQEPVD